MSREKDVVDQTLEAARDLNRMLGRLSPAQCREFLDEVEKTSGGKDPVLNSISAVVGANIRNVSDAPGWPPDDKSPEIKPETFLSLTEAQDFLKEHGIDLDLENAKQEDVKSMVRWRAVRFHEAREYATRLDGIQVPRTQLEKLIAAIRKNNFPVDCVRTIFGTDDMSFRQLFRHLVDAPQLDFEFNNRISPSDFNGMHLEMGNRVKGFGSKAGICFVPDPVLDNSSSEAEKDILFSGISGQDMLKKVVEEQQMYLGPQAWLKMLRQKLDENISMAGTDLEKVIPGRYEGLVRKNMSAFEDKTTATVFPAFMSLRGALACLRVEGDEDSKMVQLLGVPIRNTLVGFGGRLAYGNFDW